MGAVSTRDEKLICRVGPGMADYDGLYQGMASAVPIQAITSAGFSPCASCDPRATGRPAGAEALPLLRAFGMTEVMP